MQATAIAEDNEVFALLKQEQDRQFRSIELIASENYVSSAVLEALGSCFTNKYSEGLPNSRYYGGNQYIDKLETLCQERALKLFSLNSSEWQVNVQPYSGSPANFAVYTALLKPHDRMMGLDLPSGGHLTHGFQTPKRKVSASSLFFESLPYRVNPVTGLIDYDEMEYLAKLFRPKLLIAGGSAYPRDWDYARMRKIADAVGAYLMADIAHIAGLVACGEQNNPFPFCDVVTTTTHKSLRGPRSAMIFSRSSLATMINQAVFPGLQGGPHNHQIAAVCIALQEAISPTFHEYIQQVKRNAQQLVDTLQISYGYNIVTEGTENHIVLWDLHRKPNLLNAGDTIHALAKLDVMNESSTVPILQASLFEKLLEYCDISVNKNCVPGDTSALSPSGIRLGTLAMTTRGMKEGDMRQVAHLLHQIYQYAELFQVHLKRENRKISEVFQWLAENPAEKSLLDHKRDDVHQLTAKFPLPGYQTL